MRIVTRNFKQYFERPILHALPEPTDFPEDYPVPDPAPGTLPGLGAYMVPRYTNNLAVTEDVKALDLLHDAVFPAFRGFMSQGANGMIRLHNKKPADWGLGTAAFSSASNILSLDDVSAWISNIKYFLLIDPHTNDSEIRRVIDADYPVSQNSVTLTTSHTGTAFTVAGFAGCDGDSTPATASITVASFTAAVSYTVTLDGVAIVFIPGTGDTTASIASFLAGALRGHPGLARRFLITCATGSSVVNLKARFGTLEVNAALTNAHVAPVANPAVTPTLTETAAGVLKAGIHKVAYTFRNEHGQTLLSKYKAITIIVDKKITVSAITPPAGCTVVWYVTPEAGSSRLRYHSENSGASFEINSLPLLSAALPPDLNKTGTEVMRVSAVFSDRAEIRSGTDRSNVHRGAFEWLLGNREKSVNRIDLKYRDSGQDYRLVELRLRDDAHIAKTKKTSNLEVNGQAIDNYFQSYRIAAGMLAELRDADFFYKWSADRTAGLLEEGDIVAITDDGSGVYNLPVRIEAIEADLGSAGLPKFSFTARKYSSNLYDDSVVETSIPIITELT